MSVFETKPLGPQPPLWWRFLLTLRRPKVAKAIARLTLDGYLMETGWLRSVSTGEVADGSGGAIPWATYPFVAFIAPRLESTWRVFEYGAGASTRFYAARVREAWAVDHDRAFIERLTPQLPPNAHVSVFPERSREYLEAIANLPGAPEIVGIDGRDRNRCAAYAVRHVAAHGVIVFDDADRAEYSPGLAEIAAAGFRRIDFWGISAGTDTHRATALFYRDGNVLGI